MTSGAGNQKLTPLVATRSCALAESSQALERAVTILLAANVKDGAGPDVVADGTIIMVLHSIGAAGRGLYRRRWCSTLARLGQNGRA